MHELVFIYNSDRPTFDRTVSEYIDFLLDEVEEFREVAHLPEAHTELADILIIAFSLAHKLGIDPEEAVREKVALNCIRYKSSDFQNGDWGETRARIKSDPDYKRMMDEFYE